MYTVRVNSFVANKIPNFHLKLESDMQNNANFAIKNTFKCYERRTKRSSQSFDGLITFERIGSPYCNYDLISDQFVLQEKSASGDRFSDV